jgi:hypothetical protein
MRFIGWGSSNHRRAPPVANTRDRIGGLHNVLAIGESARTDSFLGDVRCRKPILVTFGNA